ncbi:enoyl-CoA hydratase-related protein [Salinarimonas ramus]|uniref:2-(1,2-epoxy-1,2-dihydrophenyl)acetyl-CoA isomerase n=1 Tax=Salinarimonas ramus TaxID=690164 RepID=A0A917V3G4_9HYPH|nr:enoyl-CoA hydratase-related protein [Salinarimonas ramus]GGK31453.1 2-(1,2-epoxy-1,2-dihydrophenyl)acetyl-CoA isomerase [Salinarimonas ramus]
MTEVLTIARENGVATLALARPDKLNALTAELHAALRDALAQCADDESVRVVVLTGAGRAFSAGQDLTEDLPRDEAGRIDLGPPLARDYNPLIRTLIDYPKVTIAALNGPAVGASMNIALACDIVVAARSAYLQEAFAKIALIPDAGGTWLLPRIVGPKRAMALMLTAEPVPADEAKALGLVHAVWDDAAFAGEARAFAERLAAGPALAYRLTKQALAKSFDNDVDAQLVLEAALQREAGFSEDFAEGIAAFREKRAPRYTGR